MHGIVGASQLVTFMILKWSQTLGQAVSRASEADFGSSHAREERCLAADND